MATGIRDALKIVCEWAEKSTPSGSVYATLDALIGGRVGYGQTGSGFKNTQACIVIQTQAMDSEFDALVQSDRYVIKCYGGTVDPHDATDVFRAVYDVFHNAHGDTATGGIIRSAFETGSLVWEQETNYPYYMAVFEILTT